MACFKYPLRFSKCKCNVTMLQLPIQRTFCGTRGWNYHPASQLATDPLMTPPNRWITIVGIGKYLGQPRSVIHERIELSWDKWLSIITAIVMSSSLHTFSCLGMNAMAMMMMMVAVVLVVFFGPCLTCRLYPASDVLDLLITSDNTPQDRCGTRITTCTRQRTHLWLTVFFVSFVLNFICWRWALSGEEPFFVKVAKCLVVFLSAPPGWFGYTPLLAGAKRLAVVHTFVWASQARCVLNSLACNPHFNYFQPNPQFSSFRGAHEYLVSSGSSQTFR